LLGALVYLFEQSPGGELPANNGTLFRALARALWQREKQRGTPGWRPFEEAEARFAALAFAMIDEGRPVDVSEGYAAEMLGDEALVRLGLSASYLQGGDGPVRFYHQLFQEYFAGVMLSTVPDPERFVTPYERVVEGWDSTVRVGRWDESVVAACALADDRDDFVRRVGAANPYLAVRGMAGDRSASPERVAEVVRSLWAHLLADVARLQLESGQLRQKYLSGGSGMYDDLADSRYDDICEECEDFGHRVALVGPGAIPALAAALGHARAHVRHAALHALLVVGYTGHADALRRGLADWETARNATGRGRTNFEWPLEVPGSGRRFRPLACWAARCLATFEPEANRDVLRAWVNEAMWRPGIWNGVSDGLAFVGPPLLPAVYDVFAGGNDDTRITLAEVIGAVRFLYPSHEPPADPHVAELAALAAEVLRVRYERDDSRAGWLVGLLSHPQGFVRHHTCHALARLYLRRHLGGVDPDRLERAEQVAVPALRGALGDPDPRVRLAAVQGMSLLDLPTLADDLRKSAEHDPDDRVKKEAADAARKIGRARDTTQPTGPASPGHSPGG
jgi:hypothetical protein